MYCILKRMSNRPGGDIDVKKSLLKLKFENRESNLLIHFKVFKI